MVALTEVDAQQQTGALEALRRAALVGVALAVIVAIVATPMYMAAFGWDLEAATFVHPEAALGQGPGAAALWRWGFAGDMLFSYLLLTPLAQFLHRRLRERRPWLADLGLIGALAYILIGGASAAILAHAGSSLIEAYHAAVPGVDQAAIHTSFHLLRDAFVFGVWQTLDGLTAGTWMLSLGLLLLAERPLLARLLVMLGLWAWAIVAVATIAGIRGVRGPQPPAGHGP